MRERRAGQVILLAAILALPTVLAQSGQVAWDEVAGGAARTGAAFLPATTLDVLEARDLFGDEMQLPVLYTKALVSTPHGMLGIAERGDACVLLTIGDEGAVGERILDDCVRGSLTAYDRANDRLMVCSEGGPDALVFQARDAASLDIVWGIRPGDLGASGNTPAWDCIATTLAPALGTGFVAFAGGEGDTPRVDPPDVFARVVAFELATGALVWDRTIEPATFYTGAPPVVDVNVAGAGFRPYGLSLTDSGLVLSGRSYCACDKGDPQQAAGTLLFGQATPTEQGVVAWLDVDDGDIVGAALAEDDPDAVNDGVPSRRYGQWWAATQGSLAAFVLGERAIVVNPTEEEPVRQARFEGIETGRGFSGVVPSAWWGDIILVPVAKSVTGLNEESLDPVWSRSFGDEWVVSGMVVLPPSDVAVLVAFAPDAADDDDGVITTGHVRARIHRLDLATGSELQRIDLPGTIRMTGSTGRVGFQPMEDGTLLIYSLDGRLFTLGTAEPSLRPRVAISNEYPAPSEGVTLSIESPYPAVNYSVAWGDGTVEENGTSWTHRYGDAQPHTARVMARFADGRTATSERVIRVGEAPPPDLNALQVAFSDRWQNVTFGLLGLLVTGTGALVAFYARRRRHSRLHDELVALERIREQGRTDVPGAVRALGEFRERVLREVAAHQLDDAQFNSLEARANVVFGALRTRLLGPLAGRLSADFRHAVDVVLHDGRVDAAELATLEAALASERQLTDAERGSLTQLLRRMA